LRPSYTSPCCTWWIDNIYHVHIEEAVLEVLGTERFLAFQRQHTVRLSESSTMRQLLSGALTLFGVSPRHLYHLVPRAYNTLCRDAGTPHVVDDGPTRVRMVYSALPEILVTNACWRLGLVGTLQTMLELTRRKGTVEVTEHDLAGRRVVVTASWD